MDDEEMLRKMLADMLRTMDFEVVEAEDGRVALNLFKEQPFDLVLTDLVMPNKEGLELIVAIRRLKPDAKIIAMSGGFRANSMEMIATASAVGANAVLYKPFDATTLQQTIDELG